MKPGAAAKSRNLVGGKKRCLSMVSMNFPDSATLHRKAGSDWLKDKKDKWRKIRSWDAAAGKWTLTATGKHITGKTVGNS